MTKDEKLKALRAENAALRAALHRLQLAATAYLAFDSEKRTAVAEPEAASAEAWELEQRGENK